ncbi:MAG TPA: hypothetical protein VEL74_10505, partial [Thermoanaerobaculia bacterium]|nr:hypothetical protein [Thermoanaerobaculia bacterium]
MSNIEIRTGTIEMASAQFTFSKKVQSAQVALQGFDCRYGNKHEVREIKVGAKVTNIAGAQVTVEAWASMKDEDHHFANG